MQRKNDLHYAKREKGKLARQRYKERRTMAGVKRIADVEIGIRGC